MATVFLARDLKHDHPVALKVLHSELAASLGGRALSRGDPLMCSCRRTFFDPLLDALRTDPQYPGIVRQIGLDELRPKTLAQ
jgi:hypothetical protein